MQLSLTGHWAAIAALSCFVAAYVLAISEERLRLRKSVPVLAAAAVIWVLVGVAYAQHSASGMVAELARHTILDFGELLFFLIPAMTFVNTLEDRGLFDALRAYLVQRGLSLRALFWVTGGLAFFISPFADNLTTALLVGAVAMAVGRGNPRFIALACINIVVAANAGGAFSPFGDVTTLMVWQAGKLEFNEFFALFLPSLVNWFVPACALSFALRGGHPAVVDERFELQPGALHVLGLFFGTILLTVVLHSTLNLPPAVGMMGGLALLKVYSSVTAVAVRQVTVYRPLDIFAMLEKIEWDTLMFFYGVLMGVGGLGALGYLALASQLLYGGLGAATANVTVGLLSALIDNVPIMFAVLQMSPEMSHGHWLLVTLTTGVGGSLLSIGSAAGVALMGQARGVYTFGAHLRWTWAVALGYIGSIAVHFWVNARYF